MSQPRLDRREVLVLLGAAASSTARADGGLLEATRVDHVALTVPDIAKSMSFYRTLFGNDVLKDSRSERRYLRLGPSYASIAPATGPDQKIRVDHFAVAVKNFDAARIKASLEKAGIEASGSNAGLFVLDPDGTRIQVSADESWKELSDVAPEPGTGTPMFRSHFINHLAIRVSDLGKSVEFYGKLFAPPPVGAGNAARPQVRAGESGLIIYEPDAGLTPDIDHFCVLVDAFDTKAALAKLQALGADAKLTENGSLPEFYDPDGIRLQVQVSRG